MVQIWLSPEKFYPNIKKRMLKALTVTHDDDLLLEYIEADCFSSAYENVLKHACSTLKDPALVEKLMTVSERLISGMTGLEQYQNTQSYNKCLLRVFAHYGLDDQNNNDEKIINLFKSRLSANSQGRLTRSLCSIFDHAAKCEDEHINRDVIRILADAGGDLEDAYKKVAAHYTLTRDIIPDWFDEKEANRYKRLQAFKASLG